MSMLRTQPPKSRAAALIGALIVSARRWVGATLNAGHPVCAPATKLVFVRLKKVHLPLVAVHESGNVMVSDDGPMEMMRLAPGPSSESRQRTNPQVMVRRSAAHLTMGIWLTRKVGATDGNELEGEQ
jgi:hypothetical protein